MEKYFMVNDHYLVVAADEDSAIATYHKRMPHFRLKVIRELKKL